MEIASGDSEMPSGRRSPLRMHGGGSVGSGPESSVLEFSSGDACMRSDAHDKGIIGRLSHVKVISDVGINTELTSGHAVMPSRRCSPLLMHGGGGVGSGPDSAVLEFSSGDACRRSNAHDEGTGGRLSHAKVIGDDGVCRDLDSGYNDVNMVEVNVVVGESTIHAAMLGSEILDGRGILGACGEGSLNNIVQDVCMAQVKAHSSKELHEDMLAEVCSGSRSMQGVGVIPSGSHEPCTSGVRWNASSVLEQNNQNVNSSRPASFPRHSYVSAWNRPKVIPMPSMKDLGKFSLDGTTALLDDGEVDNALKKLDKALVGRMFGRKIPYLQLSSELKRRWESYGRFRLITLSNDCFLCLFDCAAARDAILMEGPWVLFGQVLGLERWSSSFSPSSLEGFTTPVWVRMPGLPLFCWTAMNIARIVAVIGEPLWIDSATDQMERGLFARACVRLDLSKPLKAGVWIEGKLGKFFQPLEYEGLSMFCFRCSQVGHKANNCKLSASNLVNVPCSHTPPLEADLAQPPKLNSCGIGVHGNANSGQVLVHENINSCGVAAADVRSQPPEDRGAGPWMMVVRKRRQNKGKAIGNLHNPFLQAAVAQSGHQQGTAVRGKLNNNANRYLPLSSARKELDRKVFDNSQQRWAGWNDNHHDMKVLNVQEPVCSAEIHNDARKIVFEGFSAMPEPNAMNFDGKQHNRAQAAGKGINKSFIKPSSSSLELVEGSSILPLPSQSAGGHISSMHDVDESLSSHGAIVPYNNQAASEKLFWEGGKRKGANSLKVERMLNDLGPVSLSPRKRRMIVVKADGGVASPLPTS